MNLQDAWTFNLAGSYDFGFMKTYLATQYFKDARDAGSVLDYVGFFDEDSVFNNNEGDVKFNKGAVANTGYGVHLSTAFDVLGGTMKAGIGYMDADIDYAKTARSPTPRSTRLPSATNTRSPSARSSTRVSATRSVSSTPTTKA